MKFVQYYDQFLFDIGASFYVTVVTCHHHF